MPDFPVSWIDTHAHIYAKEFGSDRQDMLSRCYEAGVTKIFMPNVDHASIDGMMEIESRSEGRCFSMMGLHPCSVKKDFQKELYLVEDWLAKRTFSAVGEIGTDLYWDKTFWEQQKEAFHIQVAWAKKYHLPIIIHCRESMDETIDMVEQLQDGTLTGVFHCFGGSVEQASRIVKLGFHLGIGGVLTFKKSGLDAVVPDLDLSRIVLETDSPYLAPVPHRGQRNEPSYVPLIASQLAGILKKDIEEISRITTRNANQLFSHPSAATPHEI